MRNPKEYCVACGNRYGFSDESCRVCAFDPMGDAEDEKIQDDAERAYEQEQRDG